jgi:putative membrane protein
MKRPTIVLASLALAAFAAPAHAQSRADKSFVMDAMADDVSEVQMGQLAQQKGVSDAVKSYGQMLVTDHGKALDDMKSVAGSLGVEPPQSPKPDAKAEMAKLQKLDGAQFDKAFLAGMVKDHQKAVKLFQRESRGQGQVADLAKQQLPVLQHHLDEARRLEGQVKSSSR